MHYWVPRLLSLDVPSRQTIRCACLFSTLLATALAAHADKAIAQLAAAEPTILPRAVPKGLQAGDTICLVAPARSVDAKVIARMRTRLEAAGFRVQHAADISRKRGYLAGTDERRAEELMAAFKDPTVDAVWPVTGGYGCTRILDRLDWDVIRQNPKLLIGFSDITALHLAFAAKTQTVTFHSPNGDGGWGQEKPMDRYTEEWFWKLVKRSESNSTNLSYTVPAEHGKLQTLRGGTAQGQLIGGNLTLVIALMGTPYEIDTEGRILFIEDVHEAPYRVDRYLSQLKLAGKLAKPAAVILGQFTDADDDSNEEGLSMEQVFQDYFAEATYPVLANFPAGHYRHNATLPMGIEAEVDADQRRVRLLRSPVR